MTKTAKRRRAIVVANDKGGAGKSTLALAITDKLTIAGHSPVVIQIDRQKRLSAALGRDVITISSDPKAARTDPGKELARFSPVLDAITRSVAAGPIVIDIGAGEVGRFSEWAALVDLDEELGEFALAEQIRQILIEEQDHQIDLATALGEDVPNVSKKAR